MALAAAAEDGARHAAGAGQGAAAVGPAGVSGGDDDRGSAAASPVIHVVPPNGGGVDRFVRDLCRWRPHDRIVHVCEDQFIVEWPARQDFVALATADAPALIAAGALGRPLALHAHATIEPVRRWCDAWRAAAAGAAPSRPPPCVVTLHDTGFADPALSADERHARAAFARAAAARTVPSAFIEQQAWEALGPDVRCRRIENGADPWPLVSAAAPAPPGGPVPAEDTFTVLVIGAIGEHKGLDTLVQTARALPHADALDTPSMTGHGPPALRLLLAGYTAERLLPGWIVDGRLWMHGAFEPAELPALVRRHGVRLAWFAPGVPESHSYALTDAWQAGLVVAVPDHGALGERVARHGGGFRYPPGLAPAALAQRLAQWLGTPGLERMRPRSGAWPTARDMAEAMAAIYREAVSDDGGGGGDGHGHAHVPAPENETALRRVAQQQLDTRFFRKELLNLQGRVQALQAERDACAADAAACRAAMVDAQAERDALRTACEAQRHELQALHTTVQGLRGEYQALRASHEALVDRHGALQHRADALHAEHAAVVRRHLALTGRLKAPLRVLPPSWRQRLLAAARRWLD